MGDAESILLETYGKPCWNALANQVDSFERGVGFEFWVLGFEFCVRIGYYSKPKTQNSKLKTQNSKAPLRACSQTEAKLDATRSVKTCRKAETGAGFSASLRFGAAPDPIHGGRRSRSSLPDHR